MIFGIVHTVDPITRTGPTKYWAECEEDRIEFTIFELRVNFDPKFHKLFDYIESLIIHTDMTDEEYEAQIARSGLTKEQYAAQVAF